MEPKITINKVEKTRGYISLRLEGGDISPEWAETLRKEKFAWCDIGVYCIDSRGPIVSSFCGEVWPGAWPHLFEFGPRTTQGQLTTVKEGFLKNLIEEELS